MSLFYDFLNKKNRYCFNNSWNIDAPVELIWDELINYKQWPLWCDGLERIEKLDEFDHLQIGNNIRSTWKGSLPYNITFDSVIKDFMQYSFLSFNVTGDLRGEGLCSFLPSQDNTTINFKWKVSPTQLWIKMSSPFARTVFIENHNYIMRQVVSGFTRMIAPKISSWVPTDI